jgi:hypothetical protein
MLTAQDLADGIARETGHLDNGTDGMTLVTQIEDIHGMIHLEHEESALLAAEKAWGRRGKMRVLRRPGAAAQQDGVLSLTSKTLSGSQKNLTPGRDSLLIICTAHI